MSESALVRKILVFLRKQVGGWWMKVHGGAYQARGVPDILGCYKGKFVALEVKTPENRKGLTPLQLWGIMNIRQAGGVAHEVRSLEEVKSILDGLAVGGEVPRLTKKSSQDGLSVKRRKPS